MIPKRLSSRCSADDSAICADCGINIDYLAHSWEEEHIWSCWKFITSRRGQISHHSRLENAIWRAWAKRKNNLRTISPTTINWLRENDVHYLYGPSWSSAEQDYSQQASPTPEGSYPKSRRRSILKERSISDVLIQATRSSFSLSRQATTANEKLGRHRKFRRVLLDATDTADLDTYFVRSETSHDRNNIPPFGKLNSKAGKKSIQFCNEVKQRISIQAQGDDNQRTNTNINEDKRDAYEGVGMRLMRVLQRGVSKRTDTHSKPKPPIKQEMIALFPSTTLKS